MNRRKRKKEQQSGWAYFWETFVCEVLLYIPELIIYSVRRVFRHLF